VTPEETADQPTATPPAAEPERTAQAARAADSEPVTEANANANAADAAAADDAAAAQDAAAAVDTVADPDPVDPDTGAATAPGAVEEMGDLPSLADDAALARALEALLLVVDSPAGEELLANALDQPVARITEALRRMSAALTERESGIDLRRLGDGWRFVTRDKYAPFVEKLLLDGQRAKLTRAALETLAVIAYRQPVTRARVAAVRGVNVDGVIRTLVVRGLIGESGTDSDTGGILYRTTELFLERLGLSSLEDLPPIAPLLPEVDAIDDV
jgi:segregation and condensation protein B